MASTHPPKLYVGLMSGTSMDGCDAVLIAEEQDEIHFVAGITQAYPNTLRNQLIDLCHAPMVNLEQLLAMDIHLARFYASTVQSLLAATNVTADQISAIGSHGQTIRHLPGGENPSSLQIGDPNLLAELSGITVVADFRRRDIAAGGQGAPLVPAFHNTIFRSTQYHRVILNIGGMANITVLPKDPDQPVRGFDTGPGNILLDSWAQRHIGSPFDTNGAWGSGGKVNRHLLAELLADNYFALAPPKSTGREYFNLEWLEQALLRCKQTPATPQQVQNIQATLCALTAESIAQAISQHAPHTQQLLICGGGWHSQPLVDNLRALLKDCDIMSTEHAGIHPDWVEGAAFAWLAAQRLQQMPGNLPEVTGARHLVVLGAIYAAPIIFG